MLNLDSQNHSPNLQETCFEGFEKIEIVVSSFSREDADALTININIQVQRSNRVVHSCSEHVSDACPSLLIFIFEHTGNRVNAFSSSST